MKNLKVAFIHGRPEAHPTHQKYAKAVNANFYYVDHKLRYHDLPQAGPLKRYFSWLWTAVTFPRKKYSVFFSEEAYFMVGLMKWLGLLRKDQKIISLMATHTPYFLTHDRYAPSTKKASIKLLQAYDGFICGSQLQKKLIRNLIGEDSNIPVYAIYNGVEVNRFNRLYKLNPDLESRNIVFIGAVPNSDRVWYKGIDLMLAAFPGIRKQFPDATFTIIGEYDAGLMEKLLNQYCPEDKAAVVLAGKVNNLEDHLKNAGLYLHTSRGEAWGISITEAMAAGVPPIVSDQTGAMEAVVEADERLVTTLAVKDIETKVSWYFNLPAEEKRAISARCKEVVKQKYTEDKTIPNFRASFEKLVRELQGTGS